MLSNYLRLATSTIRLSTRPLHSSQIAFSVNKSPLLVLRQKTGLAYNLCREALNKHDNNVEEAEAWLKAQALSHGLQKATKVGGRSAKEGLVGLAVDNNNISISVLELNCETDFVAKNQIFKDLALSLTEQVALMKNNCSIHQIPDQRFIEELRPPVESVSDLKNQIAPLISRLGENIRIQKATNYRVNGEGTNMFGQIHSQAGQKSVNSLEIGVGRFAALVALRKAKDSSPLDLDRMKVVGNRLCKHVIGFSPSYIELPDNIRKHLEQAEREKAETNIKNDDNDEDEHSDSEQVEMNQNNRDDWPSIMDQMLIMSEDQTVRDFCRENEVSITYFKRLECGDSTS